ncbi:MAG: ankyrin repeat domain-containing protein [Nannocystis sp.]|nr:ankyrin repeat domain-containing protein [Nannocystis sp.]MBA3549139.1 ankyrin repeat domain-containing protein [Nannocystis sp.]
MAANRLFKAVHADDLPALRAAIAARVPLDERDAHGYTPLLVAARAGRTDLCVTLLDAGARPDAHDRKVATRRWQKLAAGTPAQPSGPGSLLHEAAAATRGGDLIRCLLARGLDIEARDPDGSTPLMIAAFHHADDPLTTLLAAGASVHTRDRAGHGALDAATTLGAIERLLAAGADPNGFAGIGAGHQGRPLLVRWSMSPGDPAVVRALLLAGADPQKAGGALAWAAHFGHQEVVRLLLHHGFAPDDSAGETPALAGAAAFAHLDIAKMLVAAGAKDVDVALFCAAGHSLLSGGPDIREHLARRLDVMRVLIAAGADPSAHQHRFIRSTALHTAARVGSAEIAGLLLAASASVHAKDDLGRTPLWVAAESGSARVAELLLRAGAVANTTDNAGVSAYEIARKTTTPAGVVDLYPTTGAQMRVMALLRDASAGPPKPAAPARPEGPAAGDRVGHAKFGEGTIHSVDGEGPTAKLTIDFDTAGQKVLQAKFVAPLPPG